MLSCLIHLPSSVLLLVSLPFRFTSIALSSNLSVPSHPFILLSRLSSSSVLSLSAYISFFCAVFLLRIPRVSGFSFCFTTQPLDRSSECSLTILCLCGIGPVLSSELKIPSNSPSFAFSSSSFSRFGVFCFHFDFAVLSPIAYPTCQSYYYYNSILTDLKKN